MPKNTEQSFIDGNQIISYAAQSLPPKTSQRKFMPYDALINKTKEQLKETCWIKDESMVQQKKVVEPLLNMYNGCLETDISCKANSNRSKKRKLTQAEQWLNNMIKQSENSCFSVIKLNDI